MTKTKVIKIFKLNSFSRNSPGILISDQTLNDLPDGKITESSALSSSCPGSPPGGVGGVVSISLCGDPGHRTPVPLTLRVEEDIDLVLAGLDHNSLVALSLNTFSKRRLCFNFEDRFVPSSVWMEHFKVFCEGIRGFLSLNISGVFCLSVVGGVSCLPNILGIQAFLLAESALARG